MCPSTCTTRNDMIIAFLLKESLHRQRELNMYFCFARQTCVCISRHIHIFNKVLDYHALGHSNNFICIYTYIYNTQVIEALLTAGITADTLNRDGYSAFLLSVRLGNIAVTRELLRQGCSPNVRNPLDGNSALHLAYQYGEGEMAQMLLAHGCQQDCYNNLYESPVYRVILNNRINTVKYLAIANYDFDIPALLPSDQNDVEEPLSLYKVALSNGCINICCMLYFVNCDVLTADLFLSLKDDVQSRMEFDERYFMLRNIPSLKCLSRKRVRKSLNWNIAIAIESLFLPPSVKDYVILADNNMCM